VAVRVLARACRESRSPSREIVRVYASCPILPGSTSTGTLRFVLVVVSSGNGCAAPEEKEGIGASKDVVLNSCARVAIKVYS